MINEPSPELLAITLDVRGLASGRRQRVEVPRASNVWCQQKNRGMLPTEEYYPGDHLLARSDFGLTRLELGFTALPDQETGRYATLYDPAPEGPTAEQVWQAITGSTEPWGGCADREAVERVLAVFRG